MLSRTKTIVLEWRGIIVTRLQKLREGNETFFMKNRNTW